MTYFRRLKIRELRRSRTSNEETSSAAPIPSIAIALLHDDTLSPPIQSTYTTATQSPRTQFKTPPLPHRQNPFLTSLPAGKTPASTPSNQRFRAFHTECRNRKTAHLF